jgi:hypothetical protein
MNDPHDNDTHDDAVERRVQEAWRSTPPPSPGARERLRAELRKQAPPRRRAPWVDWWLRPRELHVSPLALAGGSALVLLIVGGSMLLRGPWSREPARAPSGSLASTSQTPAVGFVLVAPDAHSVSLVGDFNDWDPRATPMTRASSNGLWTIEVPLEHGLHLYGFVIDQTRWVTDPTAPLAPGGLMGQRNSVIVGGEI